MNDKMVIVEYFANDESPATIESIEKLSGKKEHYYIVKGKDENGKFETCVFVDAGNVFILPE